MEFQKKVNHIDELIRSSELTKAKALLYELIEDRLTRPERLVAAKLARRLELFALGLGLLRKYVRPSDRFPEKASDAEKAEYGANLTGLGAVKEALFLLKSVDKNINPQALLFEAFALFTEWRYPEAIPLLTQYCESAMLSPYETLVGKVNLASSLIFSGNHLEARTLLTQLKIQNGDAKNRFVLNRILQLEAANAVYEQDWNEAKACIKSLDESFGKEDTTILKWQWIVRLFTEKVRENEYGSLKQSAIRRKDWEFVRECDRFFAIRTSDISLMTKLYYGTPFASYRRRLLLPSSLSSNFQESFTLFPEHALRLDLITSEIEGRKKQTSLSLLPHHLLILLCSDFYRPLSSGQLFGLLFSEEYFNPKTSPAKIHDTLRRLREWCKENKLPLVIDQNRDGYSISSKSKCTVCISKDLVESDEKITKWLKIAPLRSSHRFTTGEAAKILKLPLRTTRRLLGEAVNEEVLKRTGMNRETAYEFNQAEKKKAS